MHENIKQMRKRHKAEIDKLQRHCNHQRLSAWMPYYWAVMHHAGYEVRVCEHCGLIRQYTGGEIGETQAEHDNRIMDSKGYAGRQK